MNPYQELGVDRNAAPEMIRKAYLKLVREYHPDRYPEGEKDDATAKLQRINAAYEQIRGQTIYVEDYAGEVDISDLTDCDIDNLADVPFPKGRPNEDDPIETYKFSRQIELAAASKQDRDRLERTLHLLRAKWFDMALDMSYSRKRPEVNIYTKHAIDLHRLLSICTAGFTRTNVDEQTMRYAGMQIQLEMEGVRWLGRWAKWGFTVEGGTPRITWDDKADP